MAETILVTVACVSFIAGGVQLRRAFKLCAGERTPTMTKPEFEARLLAVTLIVVAFGVAIVI